MTLGAPISTAEDVPFFFRYFWALAVLVNVVNGGLWWYRGKSHRERDPSLADGYRSLVIGFIGWASIPWFVMGAGQIFGGLHSPFAFLAFFLSVFVLCGLTAYWLFARDGAEKLVRHPGLFGRDPTNPTTLKLVFLVGIAGGIAGVVMMLLFGFPPAF